MYKVMMDRVDLSKDLEELAPGGQGRLVYFGHGGGVDTEAQVLEDSHPFRAFFSCPVRGLYTRAPPDGAGRIVTLPVVSVSILK